MPLLTGRVSGLAGLTSRAMARAAGISSCTNSTRFGPTSTFSCVTPVTLPPGRLRLETRLSRTGSPSVAKTIGIQLVAALAASAPGVGDGHWSHEGNVRKFLHDHLDAGVFAPDAVSTLIAAFDGAWQSIIASGARLSDQQSELTRELLAKYIIEQARQGELDEHRLRDGALRRLAHSNLRSSPPVRK